MFHVGMGKQELITTAFSGFPFCQDHLRRCTRHIHRCPEIGTLTITIEYQSAVKILSRFVNKEDENTERYQMHCGNYLKEKQLANDN